MKVETLEEKVKETKKPVVTYEKIISERLVRAERYKTKVLYAGIAAALATGTAFAALYYFITN